VSPSVCLDAEQVLVVRQAQRPDEEPKELGTFPTAEAANDYLRANFRKRSR
jgi:hypothetical protein